MEREIVLDFIHVETGETVAVKIAWLNTTAAIAWHEARGWKLFEGGVEQ